MSLNDPSITRTSLPDFVYAASNPTSPAAYLDYVRLNQITSNIEGDWEMFQAVGHGADGDHSGFFEAANFEYVNKYLIRVAGDYTHFQPRRPIKLDCGADGIRYAAADFIYAAGGYTYFQLHRPLATVNLSAAWFGIQDPQAMPEDLFWGAYYASDDTNLLDSEGYYTAPVFSPAAEFVRIKAQGLFSGVTSSPPAIFLSQKLGAFYSVIKEFRLNQIAGGFTADNGALTLVTVVAPAGAVCRAFSFWIG